MFKALRRSVETSLPGVRGAHQAKGRSGGGDLSPSGDKDARHTERNKHDRETKEAALGVKSRLEVTSEEHWRLVAGQVFQAWTGDACPRRCYQASLAHALTHRHTPNTEGGDGGGVGAWGGRLSPAAVRELAQLAGQLGLGTAAQQLAWWLVGSRLASVDAAWTLRQVEEVQACLDAAAYTEEEQADLLHSLTLYVYSQVNRLKALHTAFPHGAGTQLTLTLRTLRRLEDHPATRRLLDTAGQPPIPEDAAAALQRHAHDWWGEVVKVVPGGTYEVQLGSAVTAVTRVPALLRREAETYHETFQRELTVPYDDLCRREARSRLDHLAHTLLTPGKPTPQVSAKGEHRDGVVVSHLQNFAVGSPLWLLYKSLGRAYSACDASDSKTTAASHYPACFLGSVAAWLEPAGRDAGPGHSGSVISSLQDVLTAFMEAREWWRELSWPDPETRGVVAAGLLGRLCSLATRRCQGVVARPPRGSTRPLQPYFDIEFCSSLKSVSRVALEVQGLSQDLGLAGVVQGMRGCGRGGAADQAQDTFVALLASVGQNLENLLDQYMDGAIDQALLKLGEEVVEVCERGGNETPPSLPSTFALLQEHLPLSSSRSHYLPTHAAEVSPDPPSPPSPCLSVCASPSLLQRLLLRLWDAVVLQFMVNVAEKTGRQTSEYFCRVHTILEATFRLFTSPGRLHPRAAATPGYRSVVEQVKAQRVSCPSLILQYYHTRHAEQTDTLLPTLAHVLVRAFHQPGHLTVRVLEARDVAAPGSRSPPRYHVTLQLVPRELRAGAALHRTTPVTHCPASFYQTFEFPTGECQGEGGAALLHFTLEAPRGSSTTGAFIGEAFLPLAAIPYVDSPHLQNTTLRMTAPNFPHGYECVEALRAWASSDEQAASFLRMLERRHPEARGATKRSKNGP
ncbi:Protein unc-13 D [Chionoecetes opilio]|uniref:Protein unc-13 D n=1 Tax=Chionoecetes opilio TaxID=41210 RepID=A0A8J4XPN9_CHIOP|nr:Protein unc-13 D [Chionoecetes opilio]